MQDAGMNVRVKNILLRICQESNYVTIATIAKDLGVSAKTILRELDEVEDWFAASDCSLRKKTGAGIKVHGSEECKKQLLQILHGERNESGYSPKERQTIIISELLQNQEPVKLYNFAVLLKVTDGTISNDLDKVDQWFMNHELTLVRKPGLGVYIEGRERDIRKAMIHFIYENMDEDQLLKLIRSNVTQSSPMNVELIVRKRLLNLMDEKIIHKLEAAIHEAENKIGFKLTDSAYVGLIVHLALALQRLRKNEEIRIDECFLQELKKYPEFAAATNMATEITKIFGIEIPEDEIGYITMHLKGSKNQEDYSRPGNKLLGNFELVKLSKEMIKIAEFTTGHLLTQNKNLLIGLVNHLGPALSRLKMNLDIRNPLLEKIKTFYPDLLEVSRKCTSVVEKHMGIKMPESEIGYIAMHIGAAIENCEKLPKPVFRCVIACSTGIGTSRLLAARIEKEYDNIQIMDVISTIDIKENWLMEQSIEFVISTVIIENCLIPVVTVNPLLFEEDMMKINRQIRLIKNGSPVYSVQKGDVLELKDKLLLLKSYNQAILQILEHFFLAEDKESTTVEELIIRISTLLSEGDENKQRVAMALRSREEKGATFITGQQFILLHCRTDAVEKLYFGAVRIGKSMPVINGKGIREEAKLGIVMLAPENCSKADMETISYVSRMLIERPAFTRLLRTGSRVEAFKEVSNILEEFYRQKNNNLMGV